MAEYKFLEPEEMPRKKRKVKTVVRVTARAPLSPVGVRHVVDDKDPDSAYLGGTLSINTPSFKIPLINVPVPGLRGSMSGGLITDANGVTKFYYRKGGTGRAEKGGPKIGNNTWWKGMGLGGSLDAGYSDGSTDDFQGQASSYGGSAGPIRANYNRTDKGKQSWELGIGPKMGFEVTSGRSNTTLSDAVPEDAKILLPLLNTPGVLRWLLSSKKGRL